MQGPSHAGVALRALVPEHARTIAAWTLVPGFVREADWTPRSSLDEYESHHRQLIQAPPVGHLRLGVFESEELVGYVDFHGQSPVHRELGFLIGVRDRWGTGLGLGAAAASVRYGFVELQLREIRARAFEANVRSVRILRRLGFRMIDSEEGAEFGGAPTSLLHFTLSSERAAAGSVVCDRGALSSEGQDAGSGAGNHRP
ncbi:GNAT family N-acetyltransferase [Actinoplanes sp. NPDC026670]|uniref:GNAT family N-acetyltransferase n=1 Tax=Actinoplanes sp. NPDC026670 TaxID=3154700 RepID=UPI0033CF49FA